MEGKKDIVQKLIEEELSSDPNLLGINVGTFDGYLIASKTRSGASNSAEGVASSNSTVAKVSSLLSKEIAYREASYSLVIGSELLILSLYTENISIIAFIGNVNIGNREIDRLVLRLKELISKIEKVKKEESEIVESFYGEETTETIYKSIPNCSLVAIVSKRGHTISVIPSTNDSKFPSYASWLFTEHGSLLNDNQIASVITSERDYIFVFELTDERLLIIRVFKSKENTIAFYLEKIKSIIKNLDLK